MLSPSSSTYRRAKSLTFGKELRTCWHNCENSSGTRRRARFFDPDRESLTGTVLFCSILMVISDLFESKVKLEATKEEMRREEDLRQSYQVLLFFWKVSEHDNKTHKTKRIP